MNMPIEFGLDGHVTDDATRKRKHIVDEEPLNELFAKLTISPDSESRWKCIKVTHPAPSPKRTLLDLPNEVLLNTLLQCLPFRPWNHGIPRNQVRLTCRKLANLVVAAEHGLAIELSKSKYPEAAAVVQHLRHPRLSNLYYW